MKSTATAGANIAFVKYWGQADPTINLPLNDSISLTLDAATTVTTVEFSPALAADSFVLDDRPADARALHRVTEHLDRLRALAAVNLPARVVSRNNFPAGAGIASSASGFAALTVAAAAALGLDLTPAELSRIARRASGSACRSVFGGFVEWTAGTGDADSYARPLAPPEHWPLVDIVAVVAAGAKQVPSEAGHRLAATSPLLPGRLAAVPEALARCRRAIAARDLQALGQASEADALSLHAIAMTSQPSLLYWEAGTVALLHAVRAWRAGGLPVYFTIDAGPNVHVLTLPEAQAEVTARIERLPAVLYTIPCAPGPAPRILPDHLF